MRIILTDGTIKEPEELEGSWTSSEVNNNGDLTIYRDNKYVLSPVPIMHFAAGTWKTAE